MLSFAADSLGLPYIRLYIISSWKSWMKLYVTVVQSHSRSLKLVPLGEARMQITIIVHCCDAHYAYLLSFPRYNDLLIRNLHLFFTAFTHRTFVWSNHKRSGIYAQWWTPHENKVISFVVLPLCVGQTDKRSDARNYSVSSSALNDMCLQRVWFYLRLRCL